MSGTIAIFRQQYLPDSETFIADQIAQLKRYSAVPIYEIRVANSHGDLPDGTQVIRSGGILARLDREMLHRHGYCPRLRRILRSTRVKLIHAHFLTDAALLTRFAARNRIPLVATAHGYDAAMYDEFLSETPNGQWLVRHRSEFTSSVALVLCVSEFIRDKLIEKGFPPEKLVVQRLGVDTESLQPDSKAGEQEGVLFVGRLVEKKGAGILVEAWRRLPHELRKQGLTILGDGPQMVQLRQAAQQYPEIQFLGALPRARVLVEMHRHRILALPSLRATNGDSEGLPIVAMEAHALARPLVGFDDGPISEAIADGVSGLLAPARDVSTYAAALDRLMRNAGLASKMGENARIRAKRLFDLTTNNRELERRYDAL